MEDHQIINCTDHERVDKWKWGRIIGVATISPLICISAIGNILLVVSKAGKSPCTKHSFSMILLGLCDLLKALCFVCVYLQPLIWGEWCLPPLACQLIPKLFLAMHSFTGMLTVLLTVERYLLIKHPFKHGISTRRFIASVLLMFGVHASFFASSHLFKYEVKKIHGINICINQEHKHGGERLFECEVAIFGLLVLLGLVVMPTLLRLASRELGKTQSAAPTWRPQNQNQVAIYIMRSSYLAYVTSFLPWIGIYIVAAVDNQRALNFKASLWSLVPHWFVAGSFCNAFLTYSIFSRSFRAEMSDLLCALPRRAQRYLIKHETV